MVTVTRAFRRDEKVFYFFVCYFRRASLFIGDDVTPEKQVTKNPFADHIPSFKPVDLEGKSPSNSNTITSHLELSPQDLSYLRTASRGPLATEHLVARDSEALWTWIRDILYYGQPQWPLYCHCMQSKLISVGQKAELELAGKIWMVVFRLRRLSMLWFVCGRWSRGNSSQPSPITPSLSHTSPSPTPPASSWPRHVIEHGPSGGKWTLGMEVWVYDSMKLWVKVEHVEVDE